MKRRNFILSMLSASTLAMMPKITSAQGSAGKKKALIVYYSWSGNTREIANQIKSATNADIFEVRPVAAYPSEYRATVDQARKEIDAKYRPAINGKVDNIADYDVIFVGSPNWWSTIAPPIATFLSTHDLNGKTIAPFITHEGSRMGRSVTDIRTLCPNSSITNGLAVRGGSVKRAQADVAKWLKDIGQAE